MVDNVDKTTFTLTIEGIKKDINQNSRHIDKIEERVKDVENDFASQDRKVTVMSESINSNEKTMLSFEKTVEKLTASVDKLVETTFRIDKETMLNTNNNVWNWKMILAAAGGISLLLATVSTLITQTMGG